MWEEGIHIYGNPGVYNNFPSIYLPPFFFYQKKKKLIIALFLFLNKFSYHWLICDFTFHSLFWGRRYVILFKDNGYQIYNHQWSTYFSVKHSKWVLIWIFLIMVLIWIDIFLSLKPISNCQVLTKFGEFPTLISWNQTAKCDKLTITLKSCVDITTSKLDDNSFSKKKKLDDNW